jgi:hypothetical protein
MKRHSRGEKLQDNWVEKEKHQGLVVSSRFFLLNSNKIETASDITVSKVEGLRTMSTWSQSAPWVMVSEQAAPKAPKSAERMEGAMMAGGAILASTNGSVPTFNQEGMEALFRSRLINPHNRGMGSRHRAGGRGAASDW